MPLPAYELLSGTVRPGQRTAITPTDVFGPTLMAHTAMGMRDYFLGGAFTPGYEGINASFREDAVRVLRQLQDMRHEGARAVLVPHGRIQALHDASLGQGPRDVDAAEVLIVSVHDEQTVRAIG